MFIATVINFLLFSLNAGIQVATFIVFIRKALVPDIDQPLSEQLELATDALRNVNIAAFWAEDLPVSIKLSPYNSYLFMLGVDTSQRSYRHLEGLGHLPRSTVGSPSTAYSVDWNRG